MAVVFGTRPEAAKMAPVVLALRADPRFDPRVLVTAQHREMMDQMLVHFGIRPDHDLDIMVPRQTLTDATVRALTGLQRVLTEERPDMVLVHGDTTTTLSGALAAFNQQLPVGHVEAGLRSHDRHHPYPEEIYRRLTGVLAELHFAPTDTSRANLLAEGIAPDRIHVTGNTAIDALMMTVRPDHRFPSPELDCFLAAARGEGRKLVLVEAHRRENFGRSMEEIWRAVAEAVREHPEMAVVASVHRNPEVDGPARRALAGLERVFVSDPLPYSEWANLMAGAYMVLSDSGGVQEEAPALGVPVLLLREVTERPEAVAAGTVRVVGTRRDNIMSGVRLLLRDSEAHGAMARAPNPYGDGRAAARIVGALAYYFGFAGDPPAPFAPLGDGSAVRGAGPGGG